MDERRRIPQYRGKAHHDKDVVEKELRHLAKELKTSRAKNATLERKCAKQKARRKAAECALKQDRSEAATRELKIRIQTKLDDWAFYNDKNERKKGEPQ